MTIVADILQQMPGVRHHNESFLLCYLLQSLRSAGASPDAI